VTKNSTRRKMIIAEYKVIVQGFTVPNQEQVLGCNNKGSIRRGRGGVVDLRVFCQTFLDAANVLVLEVDHQTEGL